MFNRNIVLPINLRNECAKMLLRCMKGSGNKVIKIVLSESFMSLQHRTLEQSVCGHFQDGPPVMIGQQDVKIGLKNIKLKMKAEKS